jgi:hypothetical protein
LEDDFGWFRQILQNLSELKIYYSEAFSSTFSTKTLANKIEDFSLFASPRPKALPSKALRN